jgi:hypothetical protein
VNAVSPSSVSLLYVNHFQSIPSKQRSPIFIKCMNIVEGIHFQSGEGNTSGTDKRQAEYLYDGSRNLRTTRLKQIPVYAGGPYLCDSDSDVTVPILAVEELERVEDSEE